MFTVPPVTPVTMPEEEPTVATEVLLLVQRPPGVRLESVAVPPGHTDVMPVIGLARLTFMLV